MAWCDVDDVEQFLRSIQGRNFDATDVADRLDRATDLMKGDLAGVVSEALLDSWDADLTAVPPSVRSYCAQLAAAHVMQDFLLMQTFTDAQSRAGGLYKSVKDWIARVQANKSVIPTSAADNTSVTLSTSAIVSSTATQTPVFSRSTSTATGTLENF